MRVRARHVPVALGLLAVGCEVSGFIVAFTPMQVGVEQELYPLSWLLFEWGVLAALAALLLGLLLDRRGPSVPLALLALLLAVVPVVGAMYAASGGG